MNYRKKLPITTSTILLLANGVWATSPTIPLVDANEIMETDPPPRIQTIMNKANKTQAELQYIDQFNQGLLNVRAYYATPDNPNDDDTQRIQNALYNAYKYNLVCYFPTGTYHIERMLECDQAVNNNRRFTFQILGQKKLDANGKPIRPVIQLKDNSPGFMNSTTHKSPILKVWGREVTLPNPNQNAKVVVDSENPPNTFNNVIRGIDIRTGDNPDAAALYFSGAQGCSVEDVTLDATGGYCGILKSIGVSGGYYNVTVIGGEYAHYMKAHTDPNDPGTTVTDQFPIFTGCRFYGQRLRVLWTNGRCTTTYVGCHFIKTTSSVFFEPKNHSHGQGGNLTFVDCIFEQPANRIAIDNKYGTGRARSIYIKDCYFKNAKQIIVNPGSTHQGKGNGWTFVKEYSHTLQYDSKKGENLIDGSKTPHIPEMANPDIVTTGITAPDTEGIIANHLWDEATFPAFDDPGVYNLVEAGNLDNTGATNVTSKLNQLLADSRYNTYFLPKGIYKIRGTITLPDSKRLFGVSRSFSVLRPDFKNWAFPGGNANNEDYIMTTGTKKTDAPLLSHIWFDITHSTQPGSMLSVLHWKAGKNSMIRDIFAYDVGWHGLAVSNFSALNKKVFKFDGRNGIGNAGGRVYGLTTSWQHLALGSLHKDNRSVYVTNTSEPLNFYGYNVERQIGDYQSEFYRSSNINVFGCKTEGENTNIDKTVVKNSPYFREDNRPMLGIIDCDNIFVGTVATSKIGCKDGWVHIRKSRDIVCANISAQNQNRSGLNLIEEFTALNPSNPNSPNWSVPATKYVLGVFKRGNATLNRFDGTPPTNNGTTELTASPTAISPGDTVQHLDRAEASGGAYIKFVADTVDDFVAYAINVPESGNYKMFTGVRFAPTAGKFHLRVGNAYVGVLDLYSPNYSFEEREIGTYHFSSSGNHEIKFQTKGTGQSGNLNLLLDYIRIELTAPANQNPVLNLSPSGDITMNENASQTVSVSVTDPDGDPITLSQTALPGYATFTTANNGTTSATATITINPGFDDSTPVNTPDTMTVRAVDGKGGFQEATINITINNINRSPSIAQIPTHTVYEGNVATINVHSTDKDGDTIQLTGTGIPSGWGQLIIDTNVPGLVDGRIRLTPGYNDSTPPGNPIVITLTASDGSKSFNREFNVIVPDVNAPPTIDPIENVTMNENEALSVPISVSDPNNEDSITLSAGGSGFITLIDNGDRTGSIQLSPGYEDSGTTTITISASDGTGTDDESFQLIVNNVNRQPNVTINPSGSINVEEECIHVISINASDPDAADALALSATGLPSFANLTDNDDGTGTIALNPGPGTAGNYGTITVTVNDGNATNNTHSASFDLIVEEVPAEVRYTNDFSDPATLNDFNSNNPYFEISNGELSATNEAITQNKTMLLNNAHVPESADQYKIVSRMKKGSKMGYKGAAVHFRHADWQNYSELQIRPNAGDNIRVYSKAGGSAVSPIPSWEVNMDTEVFNTFSIIVDGTNANVYLNNDFVGSATVNGIGSIGLSERSDVSIWDYFRIVSIGAPDHIENFDNFPAQDWNYDDTQFGLHDELGDGNKVLKQTAGSSYKICGYNKVISVDANYSVAVDARTTGTRVKDYDSPHLVIKHKDAANFISAFVNEDSAGKHHIRLKKVIGDVTISDPLFQAFALDPPLSVTDWHKIEAHVNRDQLSIYINGTEVVSNYIVTELANTAFSSGTECGVRSPTSNVSVEFDNFEFYDEYAPTQP